MSKKITKVIIAAVTAVYAASVSAVTAFADEAADGAAAASNTQQQASASLGLTPFVLMIIMFAALYFVAIRPQKKREQEMKDMQSAIQVGDEIVTNGGIVGIVVRTGDDTVVIETGGEKNKLRIKTWAIAENVTAAERAKAAAPKKQANPLAAAGLTDEGEQKKSKKKKKDTEE